VNEYLLVLFLHLLLALFLLNLLVWHSEKFQSMMVNDLD
jgi:hypothetical protein